MLYIAFLVLISSLIFQLSKLKSDLNDALYSDKWTPDAYLLAKSYVTDDMPPNTRCVTYSVFVQVFTRDKKFNDCNYFPDITHQPPDLFHD